MIAYKGFEKGLICLGYHFQMGMNITDKANCAANGFHCAENPLDCLTYYPRMENSMYCIVDAGGDMDEDDHDSKISCTELKIIKELSREEFFLHSLAYMADHPKRRSNHKVKEDKGTADDGYAIVRGPDPIACGKEVGDILAFAKENKRGTKIVQVALVKVDGISVKPNVWYGIDLQERKAF